MWKLIRHSHLTLLPICGIKTQLFSIATVSIWPQMSRSRRSSEFFSSFFIRSFPIITDVPGKLSYHSVSLLVKCGAQSPRKFNCISGKSELNLFPPPTIYYFKIKIVGSLLIKVYFTRQKSAKSFYLSVVASRFQTFEEMNGFYRLAFTVLSVS